MKRSVVFLLAVITALSLAPSASANSRHITVTGTGSATVAPDAVRFLASVSTLAATNKTALANANKSSNAIREALKVNDIESKDIKSSSLTVYPEYNYSQDKGQELIGYRATQSFTIVIRKAARAGEIIDAVVDAGGDPLQITGVVPFLSKGSAAAAAARKAAVADAKARATSYANALGQRLGRVIFLNEVTAPTYNFPMIGVEKAASDATQIDLGETEVTVTVNVRWALS